MRQRLLNREAEVEVLQRAWASAQSGKPQLGVMWGRRRVGKTFLLSHFAGGKRSVFFGATQQAEAVELRRFIEAVRLGLGPEAADLAGGDLSGWEAALKLVAAHGRDEPLLVVLDEVPYLAKSTPGFASIVQAVWDHLRRDTKLMLVLTGSAVGAIDSMLGAGGPLRGRPTLSLRLNPLGPAEARRFLPKLEAATFLEAYAACGGYPLHLLKWDQDLTTRQNLEALAGSPGGLLVEDAAGILAEEIDEPVGYRRVLAAIGRGRSRLSEIASDAGQRVEYPLDILVRTGFVRRGLAVGAPRRSRPMYEIADTYLAFWFAVLYSDVPLIEGGQGRAVLRRREPAWMVHVGRVFEEAARGHATRLVARGELPDDLVIGRWWASSGQPCEVDVLGLRGSRTALVGEARWQSRPLGLNDVRVLTAKIDRLPRPEDDLTLALWGRGGVDKAVMRAGVLGFDVRAVTEP